MLIRPPRRDEAEAVHVLIVARDVADIGRPDYTLRDVLDDWQRPELDVFVVEDGAGAIVGWADTDSRGARVAVHPDHERRGVGTLLRGAVEARLRERGIALRQDVIPANEAAVEHLRAAGYERTRVHQRMRGSLSTAPARSVGPAGSVRGFDLDTEGAAVHALITTAFSEIGAHVTQSYDAWHHEIAERSEPAFRLALDDDAGLAGAVVGERWEDGVGYVPALAVAGRARGRGHGRALLLAVLDAFGAAGLTIAELSVAGANTPATGLYESVGMTADFRSERWELLASP
jgi:mycothiol synthase